MGDKVVRLVDRVPAPVDGTSGLAEWAQGWIESFGEGEYGELNALVILVERNDGRLGVISQSISLLDHTRLHGLLSLAAHRTADGVKDIERLKEE